MTPEEFERLIQQREGETLEFEREAQDEEVRRLYIEGSEANISRSMDVMWGTMKR